MATDAQKARKIEWSRLDENTSEVEFQGYRCEVYLLVGERTITIGKHNADGVSGVVVYHQGTPDKSQQQAEIQAEIQLKNLAPKAVKSKFNPPEKQRAR